MVVPGVPTSRVLQRWLLRGVLVGGAVGSALLLAGPAHAADSPSPLAGLTSGLTEVVDGTGGSLLDVVSGTAETAVPTVVQAPVVRDLPVVREVTAPVSRVATDVVGTATGAVSGVTGTVRTTVVPVVEQVDAVVVEVVDLAPVVDPVVDVRPVPDEALPLPDAGVVPAPDGRPAGVVAPSTRSADALENISAAGDLVPRLGPAGVVDAAPGSSAATALEAIAQTSVPPSTTAADGAVDGPWHPSPSDGRTGPVPPATSSTSSSGGAPSGADQPARSAGRLGVPTGSGVGRTPCSDDALVPASALSPPFSPD